MSALILTALATLLLGPAPASAPSQTLAQAPPSGASADALLERLKGLAGEWVKVGEDGQPTDEVLLIYRVTAGGHAVVSTEFPGSPHEMVTVYYREGDGLAMTHYCAIGNRPHMVARSFSGTKAEFECEEGSTLDRTKAHHVHHGTFVFEGENELRSAWAFHDGGQAVGVAEFHVVRRRDF